MTSAPAIVMATVASATGMGQQEYEDQLADRLGRLVPGWRRVRVRSLRSDLPGERRVPLRAVGRLPLRMQQTIARGVYEDVRARHASTLVHRCDLRLPAARREVVTVHDLAPWRFSDEGEVPPGADVALRAARAVICPSRFSADEVARELGVEALVVPNGLDPHVWTADASDADRFVLPERFVLHSGGTTERKNLAALAEAWTAVHAAAPDVGLALCGPPSAARAALFAGRPGVFLLGRVERAAHLALMSRARVVVVPSTYEGFGFPALEAMARGTAVVAAQCASLPEVCGDAALLCSPAAAGLARALLSVLDDDQVRLRLEQAGPQRARAFTWDRSAARHAEILLDALRPAP